MTKRWITEEALAQLPPAMTRRALATPAAKPKPRAKPAPKAANDTPPPLVAPVAAPKMTGKQRMQAKGRLPTGTMNKTETAYSEHLELRKRAGEIAWYHFEGIKLRLAVATTITVDFAVMLADGTFEMHDVKGARAIYEDDAKVKMKVAAEMYPFVFRVVFPIKATDGGGWDIEEVKC